MTANNIAFDVYHEMTRDSCSLRAPVRHFAMVLAQLSNWRTGRGIAGQGRIAEAMGCDVRTVRKLKAELAAAEDCALAVTWSHRTRPDGLNGSDAYRLSLRYRTGMQGERIDDPRHRIDRPTNISTGVPIGTTPVLERENDSKGDRPQASPKLITDWSGPNATHRGSAKKLGADLADSVATFRAYHEPRGELRTHQGWDRGFGGWLKRQPGGKAAAPLTAAQIEAAEIAAWKAEVAAA